MEEKFSGQVSRLATKESVRRKGERKGAQSRWTKGKPPLCCRRDGNFQKEEGTARKKKGLMGVTTRKESLPCMEAERVPGIEATGRVTNGEKRIIRTQSLATTAGKKKRQGEHAGRGGGSTLVHYGNGCLLLLL